MSLDPAVQSQRSSGSVLCAMLLDVADTLRSSADTVFANEACTVLTEDDGDVDTLITKAVGSTGLCVTIMFRQAKSASRTLPGPVFAGADLIVEIAELAAMNRADGGLQVSALEAAETAAAVLHQARMPSGRILMVTDILKYPQAPAPADNCYHVVISTGEVTIRRRG